MASPLAIRPKSSGTFNQWVRRTSAWCLGTTGMSLGPGSFTCLPSSTCLFQNPARQLGIGESLIPGAVTGVGIDREPRVDVEIETLVLGLDGFDDLLAFVWIDDI